MTAEMKIKRASKPGHLRCGRPAHGLNLTKCLLAGVFVTLVFLPLLRMFAEILLEHEHIRQKLAEPVFREILVKSIRQSVMATLLSTFLTVSLAYAAAWCTERAGICGRGIWNTLFLLPMLIPSVSIGWGLRLLIGQNGFLTKFFGIDGGVYGLPTIVMGSVLYAFPVAFLMLADVMRYEDASPYEAARVLGIGRVRQFTSITWPYLRKPLISVVFSTFTLIITDYGIPNIVGDTSFKTIAQRMYEYAVDQIDFSTGSIFGCLLLVPAVLAFLVDLFNKDKGNAGFVTKPFGSGGRPGRRLTAYAFCAVMSLIVLLPIGTFVIKGFFDKDMALTLRYAVGAFTGKNHDNSLFLRNSLLMATLVSCVGVCVAFLTAYLTARTHSGAARFLHLSAITSAAIPGIVLGLSYALVFSGSFLRGTLAILIMVNTVHFISSPYLMMYNSLSKLNGNLEAVGNTLGIDRLHMIKDVFLPTCRGTLLEMFSYFFVNCMMTISAVSILSSGSNRPLSLMLNKYENQSELEYIAIVSLVILLANLAIKGIVWAGKRMRRVSKA